MIYNIFYCTTIIGANMKFTCRKIIENNEKQMGTTQETIWAYILKSDKDTKSGRYRIRITRFNADQLRMMSGNQDIEIPEGFSFGLQANLDIWDFQNGWIPMLDWMGDPEISSDREIQRDLNEQIQAFLTGAPSDRQQWVDDQVSAMSDDEPKKVKPKKSPPPKPVKPPKVEEPSEESEESSEEESDDDWI
jgi:hypothetical protein